MYVPQAIFFCAHWRNVFLLFHCVLVFFSPCGWWNVLGSGADGWQASQAAEWHGSERVPWPCGWPRSGGCLATRRPRAGCTQSQWMMDWPMWAPVGKPSCYFDLLFGQRSEHTLVMSFDWLLWLVTRVLGLEQKPSGFVFEVPEITSSPILCVKCTGCKQLWQTVKPPSSRSDELISHLSPLSYCSHHCSGITECDAAWASFVHIASMLLNNGITYVQIC